MSLEISVVKQPGGVCIFKLDGRLEDDTYESLKNQVEPYLNDQTKVLILDLEKLEYISSIGLGVIFEAKREIEAAGNIYIMANLQPQIKKIFEIVKALPEKAVFETMEEVDKYLNLMQEKEKNRQKGIVDD